MYEWLVLITAPMGYQAEYRKRLHDIAHDNNGISYIDVSRGHPAFFNAIAGRPTFANEYDYYFDTFDDGEAAKREMFEFVESLELYGTTIELAVWDEEANEYEWGHGLYLVGEEYEEIIPEPYFPEPDIEFEELE